MELIIIESDQKQTLTVSEGDNLLQVLRKNGLIITAPCGGKGTCLKCTVQIDGIGSVLSCQTILDTALWQRAGQAPGQPLTIRMPERIKPQVSTSGMLPQLILSPLIGREQMALPLPDLQDQRPDDRRLADESGRQVPWHLLRQLPQVLRNTGFAPTWFFRTDTRQIQRFIRPDSPGPFGMAVDIGTTTLAAYLCELKQGRLLASDAMLNPQRAFGADVISRIEEAAAGHQDELQRVLVQAIGDLADRLLDQAGHQSGQDCRREDIAHVTLAGNTVMMHLLGHIPADAIARTPFIPASVSSRTLTAADLNLPLQPDTICQLLPSIAAYVGADITAGILATGLRRIGRPPEKKALLLDIGTNGEIVLADANRLIACSTAAGPAFEAANISCGLGGIHGAIDRVGFDGQDLTWTIIGQEQNSRQNGGPLAAGICGSGLVAAIATFLRTGIIDETGRITDEPEALPAPLAARITEQDGLQRIILADAAHSASGSAVYLSQKDIRELQNAKAAIAAGILLLLEKAGLSTEDLEVVYIAGGFGNFLSVEDALTIGLLPPGFQGKIRSVGNTAGMGALACLLEQELFESAAEIAAQVTYYELSAEKRFTDLYIDAMLFPETV